MLGLPWPLFRMRNKGHVKPAGTYWYLSASPELMELAAARLESRVGGRP